MYDIEYFIDVKGVCPFEEFLEASTPKVQAKFIKLMELLEEHGPNLKRPYADFLRDGIYELRVAYGTNQYRALYYYVVGRRIVITHGIIKKTDKVPPSEIDRAIRRQKDFEERRQKGLLNEEDANEAEDVQEVEGEGS